MHLLGKHSQPVFCQEVESLNENKDGFIFLSRVLQLSPISSQLNSTNICCLSSLCKALCWVLGIQNAE